MDAADRIHESAEDITAAEIAPSPINVTHCGVRCFSASGRMSPASPRSAGFALYSVAFQSIKMVGQHKNR